MDWTYYSVRRLTFLGDWVEDERERTLERAKESKKQLELENPKKQYRIVKRTIVEVVEVVE